VGGNFCEECGAPVDVPKGALAGGLPSARLSSPVRLVKEVKIFALCNDLPGTKRYFSGNSEVTFPPGASGLSVFYDENGKIAGIARDGVSKVFPVDAIDSSAAEEVKAVFPFFDPNASLPWFFDPTEEWVSDESRPADVSDLSVVFNWGGSAKDIVRSIEEDGDDPVEQIEFLHKILDMVYVAKCVGYKIIKDCEWTVSNSDELNKKMQQDEGTVISESCFVIACT
jgi:hypothetical protein